MTPYEAMMKAADHIEANPKRYCFIGMRSPRGDEGEVACMWGWTGHFLGMPEGSQNWRVAKAVGDRDTSDLYCFGDMEDFLSSPLVAASQLRRYAKHRFPLDHAFLAFKESLAIESSHEQV